MIVCVLTENEIAPLYRYVATSMNESIKSGKKYNPDQVMKRLYTTMSKTESKDPQDIKEAKYHAANFVQYVPALMIDLAMDDDYRTNLNIDPTKIGELYGMYTEFRSENGLNIIIDKFSKKRNTNSLKADVNTKKENKNKPVQKEPEEETPTYDEVRYKPYSSLKGTMQEYVAVDPTKKKLIKPEQRDKNRANIVNTLRSIENQLSVSDDGLTTFEYEGKELALKAMSLLTFYKDYEKFVDPATKANITRTAGIISKGGQLPDVTTPDQQVVIILTDNNGKILYFDQEGNITTEDSPNAAIVYQFLHDVRKTKDGYTVTDIYNKENKILSPEKIAESTYIKELDGDYNTYLEKVRKDQREEFEALYNFKEEVINAGERRLEFTGISKGMSSDLTNKIIEFDILKSLGVTRKDFKTIETLKKAERGLPKGVAVMTINGRKFQVDRVNVSNDIVDQIAEVLFNKNLTYMQRFNFLNQFIPSGSQMADSVRRHEWSYKKETEFMIFKTYQYAINDKWKFQRDIPVENIKQKLQPGQTLNSYLRSLEQDGKYKFFVVDSGKTVKQFDNTNIGRGEVEEIDLSQKAINNYTEAYIKEAKEKIKDSLKRGWKEVLTENYNPTKLNFNEELLADGEYLVYDISTSKFIKKDYLDFIMSLDTTVTIKTQDPGIYNNYINFSITKTQPTRVSKKEIVPTPVGDSLIRQKQKEVVRAIKESPYESLTATITGFRETQQKDGSPLYTLTVTIEGQEGEFTIYRAKNKPVIGETFDLQLEDFKSEDGKTVWPNTVRGVKYDKGYNLDFGVLAATDFSINEEPVKGIPVETYEASKTEIVAKTTVPGAEAPENTNTNTSKILRDDDDLVGLERAGKFTKDNMLTLRKKAKQAKTWWNESETGKILSKYIELDHAANIVNSNVFADFVVAGANLLSEDKLGKIRISALRGSFIDIYHESFHVFTQLFLTKDQKVKLYEEVRNYTDANGKSPYAEMSYFEIEEMLAEDFRTYAKNQKPQKDTPVKNTLFRRMLNFLKALFNKASKVLPTIKRDIAVDSSSVPVVGELFENLYFNNNNFLNNYKPSIENVAFNQLDRGVTRVANSRDQILSETDSNTMVSAIDSIISEEIDQLHDRRKSAGQVNLKSGVLGMLTNDTNRTKVYGWVKERLEEKLQSYKDKLYSQPGIKKFSEFTTLEDIKNNAAGVLEAVKGDQPKYIFLKSQIDTFNDLIPDIKKGRRVKGDMYYDIRIVADFYRHATLKDGKNTVDIMVVSKLEDAEVQLNNYLKAKAKVFTGVTLKPDVAAEELNQEQEFILDNIRILETALSEFGDPLYWQKGEEPKGLIKYHLENSEFGPIRETLVNVEFEGQDDYDDMIEDENGNDIFPEEEEGKSSDSDLTNDSKVGKYSLLQLAEPRTVYILKSLFAKDLNDQFELDRFGFKKLANFKQTWNTVAKVVGGTQNISEIYDKLLKASETYPILKQLTEYKLPNASQDITNSFEADNIISFWQTFRKPRVPYIQTIFYPIYGTSMNPITGVTESFIKGYTSKVIYASTDFAKVIRAFKNEFDKSEATPYIEKINNKSYLNLPAILKKFKISNEVNELDTAMAFDFANAIGFYLDDTPDIRKALEENTTFYGLQYIFDIIKDVEAIQARVEDPNKNVATEAIEFLNRFRSNPIGTLAGKMPAQLLPSVKTTKKDITEENVVNRLADLQAKSGYAALNLGVRNAAGNTVFENIEVHSMYAQIDSLNEMSTLADAWESDEFQHMSYLDDSKNTLVKRSALLNSLFKIDIVGDSQYEKRAGRSLELAMDDGSKIAFTNEGTVSAELDKKGLFLQEMNNMLKEGFMSTIKLSDKKTTVGIRVKGGIIGDKTIRTYTDPYLYIDTDMFKPVPGQASTLGERYAINNILIQHFAAEFDRIKRVKENREAVSKIKGPNRIVGKDENGNDLMAAEVFTAFDNVLRKDTQKLIYAILPNVEGDVITYLEANNPDLLKQIKNDIASYFRQQVTQNDVLFASKAFFVDEELESKTGIEPLTKDKNLTEAEKATRDTIIKKTLLDSYTYNAWIHNFEVTSLFIGDLYQFKGEDLHKRDSGSTSGGRGFADSKTIQKFINDHFNKGVYDADTGALIKPKTYAETLNFNEKTDKYDNFVFDGKLRTGVIADAERESVYLKEMIESWEEDYITRGESPARAKELALKDAEPYTKMTESDGAAFITIDTYRTLRKLENAWSDTQETLYQKVIAGESLSVKDVKQFFPIYKLQYYGPLHDTVIPAIGMHKYAISPIIPNAEGQSERNKLQKEMLKKNIQYVVFGSGSKVSSLTADGNFDNVFADETQKSVKTGDDLVITPNVIYTRYLKNVTNVNDKYKKKVVDSTQQRVVITDGLYKEGSVKNPIHKQLLDQYNNSVKNYTNTAIAEILNNIGFIYRDGKYVANKNSLEKFVEVIKRELGQKAVPEHLVKLLGVTTSGATFMDYSIHPEASTIEKIAAQIIQKRVINQKVKGEPLIQAPTTLTNGIWDQEFQAITDPEEIRKVLGSNNLAFYRRGKYDPKTKTYGATYLAKAAIAMQSDFRYLYELKDLEGNPIKESADPLATLNALIKKDEWLDKDDNRLSITLMGPRIPNDSHNTIEGLEVWHFLDPSFGNTIIVPTEIVAKAGADFDVDKLTLAFPTLSSDGKYIKDPLSNKEFKEQLALAQENQDKPRDKRDPNLPSVEALIKRQMAALSNLSMKSRIDILKLPENFARLTRPNETHLVDRYAENIASKKEYNKLARMHQEKDDAVVSPTRGLEIAYNLDKHEVNTGGGSVAVGIFAKNNKLHIQNKQIGTELPKKYRSTRYLEGKREPGFELYDMVLRFPHNTKLNKKGEEVISMSGETTQKGTSISDINSHNLQGVLDRAKKSFPADLNITPENINMINTLINAGVDEELVFNFVNQPLIIEYIRNIQNMSGIYGKITGVAPKSKSFIRSKAIALVFEQLQKRNSTIGTVLSSAVETANKRAFDNIISLDGTMNDLTSSTPIAIPLDKDESEFFKTTLGKLKKDVSTDKVKYEYIYKIYKIKDGRVTNEVLFQKSASPVSESIYYHVANLINKKYGQEEYSLDNIKQLFKDQDNSSPQALALFLHYIQLEKALRGHESSQMLFSPDTSNVKTVNQARSTQKDINDLIKSETIDPELFNKFNEKAIVSSFRVTDLIVDTISTLLPLRLNEKISNAIDDYYTTMTSKFPGKDGKELYSTIFNDAVINYIYQNNMSNLLDEKGQVVDYPDSYKGIEIEQSTTTNRAVTIKGKKIVLNPEIIENEFTKGYYLDTAGKNNDPESYMSQGYYAFAADKDPFRRRLKEALPLSFKSNYVRFIMERELLRLTTPIEKLEDDVMYLSLYEKLGNKAYEAYLAKRSLMNSFNPNYILGKAEFTYTEDVLEAMSMVDPNTKYQIPLLGVLSEQSQIQTEDKILQLNDTLDESSAQAYYRDIIVLGDITIRKSDDPDVNKFITDIFKNFSLYMFYQHGVGYSRLGFSKALDTSSFTFLMKDAAATFLENIDDNETFLPQIYLEIKNVDNFRNYNAYDNRYETVSEEVVNANIEDDDSITDAFLRTAFGDDVSEDSPVANVITRLQEIESTNPYRAKDIDMFKQSTAFIGFETTANDPILESKSSTKVYREAFAELANKGKYSPTDIVALSGSGNFGRKGQLGIVDLTPFIDQDFKTKYAPEIDRAIEDGVRTFLLGSYNDPRNRQDYNIQKYLESKGYKAQTVQSGSYKHYRFTLGEQPTQPSISAKPDVILPIGTSGSGKSTFIKSLPQENLVVISPDDMRVEFTGDINDKSKDKEIYIEAAKRAVEAIKNDKQVVFDTTNLTKEKRRPFIEAIREAIPTANIQYKLMPLDPELAKQRIKEQLARGENRAAVSDETIDRHAASYAQMLEDIKSEGITEYQPSTTSTSKSVADIPQNKVSGIESYGSKVTANNEAIKALGPNPHSIDMIEAGFRTRTTRSESEMAKYAIKVGDIIKHFGKSADGSTKTVYAKVTAIHPKGSEGWKGTWNKEGWRAEDVNVIDRFKDGAAAIEFEVIQPSTQPTDTGNLTSISETIESLKAREAELISQKEEILVNTFEAVVVDNLPRITPESARKETGLKTGTTKDINPAWLSKDGVTIEEAAHRIWEDFYFESKYDTQDVRNVIIDVLSSAKSKKEYLDDITGQTEINQIRKDIRELQQQLTAPSTTQLDLFDNMNQPEGLPAIRRSSPNCG